MGCRFIATASLCVLLPTSLSAQQSTCPADPEARVTADSGETRPTSYGFFLFAKHKHSPSDRLEHSPGLQLTAHAGNPSAQVQLGLMFLTASNPDTASAFRWFQRAAISESPAAMNNLGLLYLQGIGIKADIATGARWIQRAAALSFAPAQMNLGFLHYCGWGVPADRSEAFGWFLRAAKQGLTPAQVAVGISFEAGEGVERDYGKALKWYRKAARANNPVALNNLGGMYEFGEGVPADPKMAATLYARAIEHGSLTAKSNLARLLVLGAGVPRDMFSACNLLLSVVGRVSTAALDSASVCGMLSAEDRAQARSVAAFTSTADSRR